jgi:hypothetical protein
MLYKDYENNGKHISIVPTFFVLLRFGLKYNLEMSLGCEQSNSPESKITLRPPSHMTF